MKKLILAATIAAVAFTANAQQLKVATGDSKLTYSRMFKEAAGKCGNTLPLIEQNTNGSMDNIDLLLGNQVNGGFVQTDVLFFRARNEDLGNIKTLYAFHPEEVHVVALSQVRKEGGVMGFGAKDVVLSNVEHLAGKNVGAVGGSAITAQVIRLQSEIQYNFIQFDNTKALLDAVNSGKISAAIIVGGSPVQAVAELTPAHKLLQFSEGTINKLKSVYRPAKVTYSKMGQGGMGIQTIATEAVFVVREYKTPKMVQALNSFRSCLTANLDEIKESVGYHPKWQAVNADNKGKWPFYELPTQKVSKK